MPVTGCTANVAVGASDRRKPCKFSHFSFPLLRFPPIPFFPMQVETAMSWPERFGLVGRPPPQLWGECGRWAGGPVLRRR